MSSTQTLSFSPITFSAFSSFPLISILELTDKEKKKKEPIVVVYSQPKKRVIGFNPSFSIKKKTNK